MSLTVKAAVRERDGYRCTKCGMTDEEHRHRYGQSLHVHRVEPGSVYTLEGCVTLCVPCHGPEPRRPASGIKKAARGPGVTAVYFELPDDLLARLERLVGALPIGSKADHIRLAILRHCDHPPSVEFPDLPAVTVPAKKARSRA